MFGIFYSSSHDTFRIINNYIPSHLVPIIAVILFFLEYDGLTNIEIYLYCS